MQAKTLLSMLVLLTSLALLAHALEQPQEKPHRMVLVQGYKGSTKLTDYDEGKNEYPFVRTMQRMFTESNVINDVVAFSAPANTHEFDVRICDRDRFFKLIKMCDIFYFAGHSGTSGKLNEQILKVKPRAGEDESDGIITASQIRQALKGETGPRIVVLNGCVTTSPTDRAPEELRLSSAFGITPTTRGRAYLGWPVKASRDSDDYLYEVLKIWRKMEHGFPTLEQAKQIAVQSDAGGFGKQIAKLDIIGDKTLRFAKQYLLKSSTGSSIQPTFYFARRGPNDADAIYDTSVTKELLRARNVPYIFHLQGKRAGATYIMKGEELTKYASSIEKPKTEEFAEMRVTPLPTWIKVEIIINSRVRTVWNGYPVESGNASVP